ncbi:MAG TPA: DoxX family protein [Actinomycetota bacterium]|nr:DoxX family protein [Actinomycetota bacterium]
MDVGLLVLRIGVGGLMFGHGAQKLWGWFGGHGLRGTSGFLESLGFRPGSRWAPLHGAAEATGGALLALGFLTPLGAGAVVGVMLVASVVVHGDKGLWATGGGYELPLLFAVGATALAFAGPGRYSLDAALGLPLAGWPFGLGAVALGLLAGVAVIAARRPLEQRAEDEARIRRAA